MLQIYDHKIHGSFFLLSLFLFSAIPNGFLIWFFMLSFLNDIVHEISWSTSCQEPRRCYFSFPSILCFLFPFQSNSHHIIFQFACSSNICGHHHPCISPHLFMLAFFLPLKGIFFISLCYTSCSLTNNLNWILYIRYPSFIDY